MIPQSLSCEQISKLSDEKLFSYFSSNARYDKTAPEGWQYAIRFGSKSLFSKDTADLFQKFKAKARSYTPPLLPHVWNWMMKNGKNVTGCMICKVKQTKANKDKQCKERANRSKASA